MVRGQPGNKVSEISQWKKTGCGDVPLSFQKWQESGMEDHGPGWPGQKRRSYLQNNQIKKGWGHGTGDRKLSSQALKTLVQTPVLLKKTKGTFYCFYMGGGTK
jgi:hypothetical protein